MLGNGKSEKIPYISGNVTFLYFRKQNFCSSKKLAQKKLLKFQEMELFRPKLKKLLTFQGVTRKARKTNKKNLLRRNLLYLSKKLRLTFHDGC